jgi:WD40 repeat protein
MPGVSATLPRGKTELVPRWQRKLDDYVSALGILQEHNLGVFGLGEGSVLGLDLTSGEERFRTKAHEGSVLCLSVSPAGETFVTGGQDDRAKVWDGTGTLTVELPGQERAAQQGSGAPWVEQVAWAPAGDRIATAAGRTVRVWNPSGELLFEPDTLASTVTSLVWRGDGSAVAATCYGGAHVWPFVEGAKSRHLPWQGSLISAAFSPDGRVLACGSQDKTVHFWRLPRGQDSEMSGYPFKPKALAWDFESKLLATAGDKAVTLWDFRGKGPEGSTPRQLDAHQGLCSCLAFHPRKGLLASGSQDTSVLLWEPRRGTRPLRFGFLEDEITGLTWHPNEDSLLGADASGTVALWSVDV